MKQQRGDWSKIVAQRVADHRISPKGDIWNNLEKDLNRDILKASRIARGRRSISLAVAMAASIATIIIGLNIEIPNKEVDQKIEIAEVIENIDIIAQEAPSLIAMADEYASIKTNPKYELSHKQEEAEECVAIEVIDEAVEQSVVEVQREAEMANVSESEKEQTATVSSSSTQDHNWDNSGERYLAYSNHHYSTKERKDVELQIYGSSGTATLSGSNSSLEMVSYDMAPGDIDVEILSAKIGKSYSYDHHLPIRFGVSAAKGLGHNLSLGSGISYTRYNSTATNIVSGKTLSQHIDMLGVPIFLNWSIIQGGIVDIYVGGEVEYQWALDAKFDGESYDISNQFSSSLHAGAALNITNRVALYLEPKFSHYFTKTELPSIINDKDVIFNLKVGLKYNF